MLKIQRLTIVCLFLLPSLASAQQNIARYWNEVLLQAIRLDFARPPVQARNLFHTSMAMYDAWAAYDTVAKPFLLGNTFAGYTCPFDRVPIPDDVEAARAEAISFAMFRILTTRFYSSPNASATYANIYNKMTALGYDPNYTSMDYANGNPAALGNYIGDCVLKMGLSDGANEQGNYVSPYYYPLNPSLVVANPGNPNVGNPNRWQPLSLSTAIDQNGNPIPSVQIFQSPEWGRVKPFAMTEDDLDIYTRNAREWYVYNDPGPQPKLSTTDPFDNSSIEFKWNMQLVAAWGSHLDPTDSVMWDISPGAIGNVQYYPQSLAEYRDFYDFENGGDTGRGHAINPKTGQPYPPQIVPRGDYTRVLAQFWADGPSSETPPGHWFSIFNHAVMDHPDFVPRFNGKGPVLDWLEWTVKAYLTLGGAVHDAAISAWGIKGWYDTSRPITALRYMAGLGQSTSPSLPRYHPGGVLLMPGFVEQVGMGDPLAGAQNQHVGKIKFYTWRGFPFITPPDSEFAGKGWILAENWMPYQRATFVTPPFAGYISGHSTYSRSAAEALTLLTGDNFFPGGMGEFHVAANANFLGLEQGPSVDVTLQWATYQDASDQTSLSRIWGGIHPPFDDIPGRTIGGKVGKGAFHLAKTYFYPDHDADGFLAYEDCDDFNAAFFPGATEICDDLDNNCDGQNDEGLPLNAYFADTDADGYGDPNAQIEDCQDTAPANYTHDNSDCNDADAAISPAVNEICDDIDNNCDGQADEGLPTNTYFADLDGDGFGSLAGDSLASCKQLPPDGFSTFNSDCDDANADFSPIALEICDSLDNNCNGLADDNIQLYEYYPDADGDGYGDQTIYLTTCNENAPTGYLADGTDCNDIDAAISPAANEICDETDNNCNGQSDDGLPHFTYYLDGDGDGFGIPDIVATTCQDTAPDQFASDSTDCNDAVASINPDAAEICDGLDNDCNGPADDSLPLFMYFLDLDGDGFGGSESGVFCENAAPSGYSNVNTDCNDTNAAVNPNAIEIEGDGLDNDCDGVTDEVSTSEAGLAARIFPNPLHDWLQVVSEGGGQFWAQVFGVSGQLQFEQNVDLSLGMAQLDFSKLPEGTYFLTLKEEKTGREGVFRIVKI